MRKKSHSALPEGYWTLFWFREYSLKFDGFWFVNPAVYSPAACFFLSGNAAEPDQTKGVLQDVPQCQGFFFF